MKKFRLPTLILSTLLGLTLAGCRRTEHVIADEGTIGYLAEDVHTYVFLPDGTKKYIKGKTRLPKGSKFVTPQTEDITKTTAKPELK